MSLCNILGIVEMMKMSNEASKVIDEFAMPVIMEYVNDKKEILPQIVIGKGKEIMVFVIADEHSRDIAKALIERFNETTCDWLIHITEAYVESSKKDIDKDYVHGTLERRFLDGDKNVKEMVLIQAYVLKDKVKWLRILNKETGKIEHEMDKFKGFLTLWGDDSESNN